MAFGFVGTMVTMEQLAKRFAATPPRFTVNVQRGLRRVGARVRDGAVRKFGHYQPSIGPFPAWPNLASYTLRQKRLAGARHDDPLIGHYPHGHANHVWPAHLRNTIEWHVDWLSVTIGTRDPLGPIHEYGAPAARIPPRPFLRNTAFEAEGYFDEQMAIATMETLLRM